MPESALIIHDNPRLKSLSQMFLRIYHITKLLRVNYIGKRSNDLFQEITIFVTRMEARNNDFSFWMSLSAIFSERKRQSDVLS